MTVAELRALIANCPDEMSVSFTLNDPNKTHSTPLVSEHFYRQSKVLGSTWCEFMLRSDGPL